MKRNDKRGKKNTRTIIFQAVLLNHHTQIHESDKTVRLTIDVIIIKSNAINSVWLRQILSCFFFSRRICEHGLNESIFHHSRFHMKISFVYVTFNWIKFITIFVVVSAFEFLKISTNFEINTLSSTQIFPSKFQKMT